MGSNPIVSFFFPVGSVEMNAFVDAQAPAVAETCGNPCSRLQSKVHRKATKVEIVAGLM